MKKFLSVFLFLAIAMVIVGCSKGKDSSGEADGTVTIEYWQYAYKAKVDLMDELIKEFEDKNPGIKVKQTTFPYEQYNEKVATLVPAGRGPDVINLYYGWLPKYIDSGYLQPLPEDTFPVDKIESEYFSLVNAAKLDDKYWAIPTAVRTLALFYNKDLFEKAGLDPNSPPKTWDELVDYAKKLTVRENGKLITEGMAYEIGAQLNNWFYDALVYQAGGQGLSEDRKQILWDDTPAGLEAFTYLVEFGSKHKVGESGFYTDDVTAFKTGNAAMNIDGSFRLGTLATDAPDLNYGVAPLPSYKEKATQSSFWANGITAKVEGEKLEASKKFLAFLTSDEVMERWIDEVGELPAKEAVATQDKYVNDPLYGPFIEQLPYANAQFYVDETAQRQYVIDAVNEVLLNGVSIEDAYNDFAAKSQKLYDDYWSKK